MSDEITPEAAEETNRRAALAASALNAAIKLRHAITSGELTLVDLHAAAREAIEPGDRLTLTGLEMVCDAIMLLDDED